MEYLIHHDKFEMWLVFFKFSILFSTVKLKLGHDFLNSSIDSKFGLWDLVSRLYFQVFPNSQRDQKLRFLSVSIAGLLNFSQFMEEIKN